MTETETKPETNGDKVEEPTDLEKKIIHQIEYYFGDFNLPKDKFLKEQIKLDDGWIPLDVMITFKKLAALTTDFDAIKTALKKSTNNLMEISEDGKSVRRSPNKPVPEMTDERQKEILSRSIYAKGFPKEGTTVDLVTAFFEKFGPVEGVQLRTYFDKKESKATFKGSIFATFTVKADADKVMESKDLKYEDENLILKWQADYLEVKKEEFNQRKQKKKGKESGKRKEKEGDDDEDNDDDEKEEEEFQLPLGTVLHMKGFSEDTSWGHIKSAFAKYNPDIAYIDYSQGNTEGHMRLKTENSAKPLLEKLTDGKIEVGGASIEVRVLEGEEEETVLKRAKEQMEKIRVRNMNSKRGRRGGRGSWRGNRGRKRKGGPHSDGPSPKK